MSLLYKSVLNHKKKKKKVIKTLCSAVILSFRCLNLILLTKQVDSYQSIKKITKTFNQMQKFRREADKSIDG